jgi:hypothetical protein
MGSPLHCQPLGGRLRTDSYLGAMGQDSLPHAVTDTSSIQAGAQKIIQIFITNSAVLFLRTAPSKIKLMEQVGNCALYYALIQFICYVILGNGFSRYASRDTERYASFHHEFGQCVPAPFITAVTQ